MTQPRSAARTKYHLQEAASSLAVAAGHIAAARDATPYPEKDDETYVWMLSNLGAVSQLAHVKMLLHKPDLDREAKAIARTA